ncbi:sodium-independent anion transporter, partial [Acinetobacter baumannii]
HADNIIIPNILILRIEASVLYFNSEHIQNQITEMIANFQGILKLVILDMSASSYVDVSGSKMLLQLSESLKSKNIQFKIVEALS